MVGLTESKKGGDLMTRLSDFVGDRSISELYDIYWLPSVLDVYAKRLAENVSPGDRVLDLACGTGAVTGYAAKKAGSSGEVIGYDPTPDLLGAARAKSFTGSPITWIEGFGEDMPFEDSSFDVVLCHQGLQYLTDPEATFAEIKRVLKANGRFHAGVWSAASDQSALGFMEDALAKHFGADQKPIHAWAFGGLKKLRTLSEGADMTVDRLEKLELDCQFESIQKFIDVQISCAGRTDENGQLALGIIDLEDERWLVPIEAISKDAQEALSAYVSDGGFSAPFCSDEISARA
jgi:ubiquinone/menaquinone biosynthesis C-methylase UbiE